MSTVSKGTVLLLLSSYYFSVPLPVLLTKMRNLWFLNRLMFRLGKSWL
jgi:hypothetical protein